MTGKRGMIGGCVCVFVCACVGKQTSTSLAHPYLQDDMLDGSHDTFLSKNCEKIRDAAFWVSLLDKFQAFFSYSSVL